MSTDTPKTYAEWVEKLFRYGDWRPVPQISPQPAPEVMRVPYFRDASPS